MPYSGTLSNLRNWLEDAASSADAEDEKQGRQGRFGHIFPSDWKVVTAADNGTEKLHARHIRVRGNPAVGHLLFPALKAESSSHPK